MAATVDTCRLQDMAKPDWSTLPDDLIGRISECFLETDDLDYYVGFRNTVCRDWRRATVNPTADGTDPRFLPTKWIMLEHSIFDDGSVTFVNLGTGRFLRKNVSHVINDFFFVGVAAGGLFVLGERAPPYQTRVLNPFTSAMARFRAPIPVERVSAVAVTSSPTTMRVFISGPDGDFVRWADQSSESFGDGHGEFVPGRGDMGFPCMAPFAGDVYISHRWGGPVVSGTDIAAATAAAEEEGVQLDQVHQLTTILGPEFPEAYRMNLYYLVESDGELLVVMSSLPIYQNGPVVYKLEAVKKEIVPVSSIGSRALFVGSYRCLSVDAGKFPGVEPGSIYYVKDSYSLVKDHVAVASWWVAEDQQPDYLNDRDRPFTLVKLLTDYCRTIKYSELEMLPPYYGEDDGDYSYYDYPDGDEWE